MCRRDLLALRRAGTREVDEVLVDCETCVYTYAVAGPFLEETGNCARAEPIAEIEITTHSEKRFCARHRSRLNDWLRSQGELYDQTKG